MDAAKINKKNCAVICGGELSDVKLLTRNISENDFVIAADKGCEYALSAGITPDLAVGDFDSFSGELPAGTKVMRLPEKKDYTDTHVALMEGLKRGCRYFRLFAALGGRLDHTMGNLYLLDYLCDNGAVGKIVFDDGCVHFVKNGTLYLNKMPGVVSVFPFGGDASGVTLKGFEYPLNSVVLRTNMPIGVSNVQVDETAAVTVKSGALIVFQQIVK